MELFAIFYYAESGLWSLVPGHLVDTVNSLVISRYNALGCNQALNFRFVINASVNTDISDDINL